MGAAGRDATLPVMVATPHGDAVGAPVDPDQRRTSQIRGITREGGTAIIEYAESDVGTTHLTIGPEINSMTDEEILELHNDGIRGRE